MRAVVQRVSRASVSIHNSPVAETGSGLVALIGIAHNDNDDDCAYLAKKIVNLRIFDDDHHVMNRSVADIGGTVLLVSQFTLYGDVRKGNRPSYSTAMPPEPARPLFDAFVSEVKKLYDNIKTGVFGADMQVSLVNDGPVTILLDSSKVL